MDRTTVDHWLTSTRSVRRRLDLIRLVTMFFLLAVTVSSCGGLNILSAYQATTGVKGSLRPTPHNGVDFGERSTPVKKVC